MRTLADVLSTPAGHDLLRAEGLSLDPKDFLDRLAPPVDSRLVRSRTCDDGLLVYGAHEIYVDYPRSVILKLLEFDALPTDEHLRRLFLWLDTDRCGADLYTVRIGWPLSGKRTSVRVSPRDYDKMETRFTPIHPPTLRRAVDTLDAYVRQLPPWQRRRAEPNYAPFRDILAAPSVDTLSALNLSVTDFLLRRHLHMVPTTMMVSDLLATGALAESITSFVNELDHVVAVFNQAIERLQRADIDPQVNPLRDDYLPLNIACTADNRRVRLRRIRRDRHQVAEATCSCGAQYSFELGEDQLRLDALFATGRWSPDVCLLVFMNDLFSGWIAGKSTALFTVVFHDVLRIVLGTTPIPVLVPSTLVQPTAPESRLVYDYLLGEAE
jgi:hypothetical protein